MCFFVGVAGGSESEELIDSLPLFDFGAEVEKRLSLIQLIHDRWKTGKLVFFSIFVNDLKIIGENAGTLGVEGWRGTLAV